MRCMIDGRLDCEDIVGVSACLTCRERLGIFREFFPRAWLRMTNESSD